MRNKTYWIIVAVLSVLLAGLVSTTAYSKSNDVTDKELARYYSGLEKQLKAQVREELETKGYHNSGITITCVMEESDNRAYKVEIHHGKIDRMEETERLALADSLSEYGFDYNHCSFSYEFLLMKQ